MRRTLVLGAVAAVLALLSFGLSREPSLPSPLLGRAAPAFAVPRFGADSVLALDSLAGRPVILNFWASWCVSCPQEAAVLEAGWRRHGDEVAFVGIAVNDEARAARAFIERYGKTYLLGADADGSVAIDYGLFGVPETFFLGSDGRVLGKHIGPMTEADLERGVAAAKGGRLLSTSGDAEGATPLEER